MQMSSEAIYARASPAVVTRKIYNELAKAIFRGSGFILAELPDKAVPVDDDAKRFAADLRDCDDAHDFMESLRAKLPPEELRYHPSFPTRSIPEIP